MSKRRKNVKTERKKRVKARKIRFSIKQERRKIFNLTEEKREKARTTMTLKIFQFIQFQFRKMKTIFKIRH